ncbi:extracellular calcium-sensing receptor-like [Rhinatrema bivittatum]|uniref:extracellular calcium-sensing receptor-like n=1 Tax=Rhinatrema bivittatum TaxID=194408 RepID=UPI00112CBCCC|nr:extracellular calcium-sensing receptor-like [Rhinatrema bivittatum]
MFLFTTCFLLFMATVSNTTGSDCVSPPSLNIAGFEKAGDIVIGGVFPIRYSSVNPIVSFQAPPSVLGCELFNVIYYRLAQSFIFATEEINKDGSLLPNLTLGFSIRDSCGSMLMAIEDTIHLLTQGKEPIANYRCRARPPLVTVVGEDRSKLSVPMATLLGVYQFPQISYASSVATLSDKTRFPSFLRTTPSDDFQAFGLARLVTHFRWTWVGIVAEDSDYGQQGSQILKKELEKAGICIEFLTALPTFSSKQKTDHLVEMIEKSTAKAIIVFSTFSSLSPVMLEVSRKNITGRVWIASDGWSTFTSFSGDVLKTCEGVLGFSIRRGYMPGFREHLIQIHPTKTPADIFIRTFWEKTFNCKWPTHGLNQTGSDMANGGLVKFCTGNESLQALNIPFLDMSDLSTSYNAYNAMYSIAHALLNLSSCQPGQGPFKNGSCASIQDFKPWQLLHYLRKAHFKNKNGDEVFFDANGNPPGIYDILNWQLTPKGTFKFVRVGGYDSRAPPGSNLIINQSAIVWNGGQLQIPQSVCSKTCLPGYRKITEEGKPLCCFKCILCSEGEISNQSDSTECWKCPEDYWPNERKEKCVNKLIEFLSYKEPLGTILAVTSVVTAVIPAVILVIFIKYRHTPIIRANNWELSFLLLISLVLCGLCSLIFIGHPKDVTCLVRQVAFGIIFALCVSCILAKTIMVVIAFNATKPNSSLKRWVGPQLANSIVITSTSVQVVICAIWLSTSPPFLHKNINFQIGLIIVECNEGSTAAFWCMLGYMGFLATVSLVVAFLSRKLPDSFNEAKFITFSMLVFVSVWLSFIPAYLSTHGKHMVAVEVFAILSSSAGLMACIFLPKCYIILLRPDMNTKEFLLNRTFGAKKLK